jgi:hypothetical protein
MTDPRIENNPLPNDAKITYSYGARAYISDCYPNFVWRNGFWYRASEELKFSEMSKEEINNLLKINNFYDPHNMGTQNHILDDSFYPIILGETRVFIKERWESYKEQRLIYRGSIIYFPHTQTFMDDHNSLLRLCYKEYSKKDPETIPSHEKIKYEDEKNMKNYMLDI